MPKTEAPIRAGVEGAKVHVARRRLYRRFFEPLVLATEDQETRNHDAQLFWELTEPLAEHLVANMMGVSGVYLEKPPHDLLYVSGLGRPAGEVLFGCLDVCVREGVGLFIIDSLGIALEGDAGDARDVIRFHNKYLDGFRAKGITLLVIDHQGKTQAGERYQNKRSFGSVYKENLARSVIQVEPGDRGEGLLTVKPRQTKHNFGPKAEPFGARLTFTEERTTVDVHTLDAIDLAEESVLNARDRVMPALKAGPAYPADIAEACIMPLGTVKNELTRLRKRGLVEYTGEIQGQARQVRLTEDGLGVTGVTGPIRNCDAVTPDEGRPLASIYINEQGEAEF